MLGRWEKSYTITLLQIKLLYQKEIINIILKIIFIPNSFFPNSLGNEILESKLTKKEFLLPDNKFIFCCFNNIVKINEGIIDIWSKYYKNQMIQFLVSDTKGRNTA